MTTKITTVMAALTRISSAPVRPLVVWDVRLVVPVIGGLAVLRRPRLRPVMVVIMIVMALLMKASRAAVRMIVAQETRAVSLAYGKDVLLLSLQMNSAATIKTMTVTVLSTKIVHVLRGKHVAVETHLAFVKVGHKPVSMVAGLRHVLGTLVHRQSFATTKITTVTDCLTMV